jgi:ferredoxin
MKRPIIEIDRSLCDGCGLCTKACAEGALALDEEGKAVLLREIYCDGLGACLDVCPTGALTVTERDAPAYDDDAAADHVRSIRGDEAALLVHRAESPPARAPAQAHASHSGCPGSAMRSFSPPSASAPVPKPQSPASPASASELSQWPIQLHLVSPRAPYFQGSDILIAADCTAFALGTFHQNLLKGKKLAIACPKLDETAGYVEKLAELLSSNTVYSLTVAIMEVPCCSGLRRIVDEAVEKSGKNIAVRTVVVGLDGSAR